MTYNELCRLLTSCYDEGEAKAVIRYVLEVAFGLTMTDVVCGGVEKLSAADTERLNGYIGRLLKGEPVQYVLGVADFGPRQFGVGPGVLIPRPETYELCQWAVECVKKKDYPSETGVNILDIGTGSGCIACTLAAELPKAHVTAWDISPIALGIARENAKRNSVKVDFQARDVLKVRYGSDAGKWNVIVSNPPYVLDSEADDMADHVLDYEPEIALFVPDDDPLLFYLHISNYAQSALAEGGLLLFEINPLFDEHIEDILLGLGFDDITIRQDQFGRNRFVKAQWH